MKRGHMYLTKDNILNLCNAVIIQAVNDYREALVKQHKYRKVTHYTDARWEKKLAADGEVDSLERFFKTNAQDWTELDTEELMSKVKEEVVQYNYDLKKLKKDHAIYKEKEDVDIFKGEEEFE